MPIPAITIVDKNAPTRDRQLDNTFCLPDPYAGLYRKIENRLPDNLSGITGQNEKSYGCFHIYVEFRPISPHC